MARSKINCLILTLVACTACVLDEEEALAGDFFAASQGAHDKICIDLPRDVGQKKLCIVVNEEWRLNQGAAVYQKRTIDGDTRLLETGAVIFDPADPLLAPVRSPIWPYPGRVMSSVIQLPASYFNPVSTGIVAFDQVVPYNLLIQYRESPTRPWKLVGSAGIPFFKDFVFDWVPGGVVEGTEYAKDLARTKEDPNLATTYSRTMNLAGRGVLGTTLAISDMGPTKTAILQWLLTELHQDAEGLATRDGLYLVPRQCDRALPIDEKAGPDGCIPRPIYITSSDGNWKPEVRVIPVPIAWAQSESLWVSGTSSAAVFAARWPNQTEDSLDQLLVKDFVLPGGVCTDTIAVLDLPAQVLAPQGPPPTIIDHLRAHPKDAILAVAALPEPLRNQAWDLARVITAQELRQHRSIEISVASSERNWADFRFAVFVCSGASEKAGDSWQRLPEPAPSRFFPDPGDGYTKLSLTPSDGSTISYQGERQIHYSPFPAAVEAGALQDASHFLILVSPPTLVRNVHAPSPYSPRGLNHSNWKWLIVKAQ